MKTFVIQSICIRCGFTNKTEIGLTNPNDDAIYKCENCKYIILTSWMEEND